jgi:hypothetical protein
VLVANTGGDRLIDWSGEFNSYIVPFSPFGIPTVFRSAQPQVVQFLYDLSASDGADPTRVAAPGDPGNGEPFGELGLVTSGDAAWQDQHGGPADPQPGNDPGARDVRVSSGSAIPATGSFAVASGAFPSAPEPLLGDLNGDGGVGAIDLVLLRQHFGRVGALDADLDGDGVVGVRDMRLMTASYGATSRATQGLFALDLSVRLDGGPALVAEHFAAVVGGIVFDYHGPERFKFVALRADSDELVVGHFTLAEGLVVDAAAHCAVAPGDRHALEVSLAGMAVSVRVDGEAALGHTFGSVVGDGPVGLFALDGLPPEEPEDVYAIRVLADAGDGAGEYTIREIALDGAGA